jgi:hypothetical protein
LSFDVDWDQIQERINENMEMEADSSTHTIKIITKEQIAEDQDTSQATELLQEDRLKGMIAVLLEEPVEFKTEIIEEERALLLKFEDEKSMNRVHTLLNDMFFGGKLKEYVEKIISALFSGFPSEEDDDDDGSWG